MIDMAIIMGILSSFLLTEWTGLLAGGLVSPGYLALYLERPGRVLVTLLAAGASRAIVGLLSRWMILYGRRRFMALVLTGIVLAWVMDSLTGNFLPAVQDMRAIGYIVPGLIANDAWKQGYLKTCLATLMVAGIVRLGMMVLA
jgi:poly-gamma-glutamate biosynthesis protein PgsC/CapC